MFRLHWRRMRCGSGCALRAFRVGPFVRFRFTYCQYFRDVCWSLRLCLLHACSSLFQWLGSMITAFLGSNPNTTHVSQAKPSCGWSGGLLIFVLQFDNLPVWKAGKPEYWGQKRLAWERGRNSRNADFDTLLLTPNQTDQKFIIKPISRRLKRQSLISASYWTACLIALVFVIVLQSIYLFFFLRRIQETSAINTIRTEIKTTRKLRTFVFEYFFYTQSAPIQSHQLGLDHFWTVPEVVFL